MKGIKVYLPLKYNPFVTRLILILLAASCVEIGISPPNSFTTSEPFED